MPDMHVWPPIRMDWRKMTKTRDSILRMNQTIVYVGFNAGKNIILILRAESPIIFYCIETNIDECSVNIYPPVSRHIIRLESL